MPNRHYAIRTMSRKEVDLATEWAAREGWNPGLHDGDCFYSADPDGFLIGLLDDEPVACISVVKYSPSFGFLGFYIIRPEYRSRGYGWQIWNAGLQRLQGCSIGLDGVVAQQDNYRNSGFRPAYRHIRYEGRGGSREAEQARLVDLSTLPLSAVAAYDRSLFPADRSRFLDCWINQPDSRVLGVLHRDRLAGYGVIRKCRSGYKIGPLFSDSPELAEALFLALKADIGPEEPFYLDTPEVNESAVALAEKYAMEVVFETARMYTGPEPVIDLKRVFGVTSFELG